MEHNSQRGGGAVLELLFQNVIISKYYYIGRKGTEGILEKCNICGGAN